MGRFRRLLFLLGCTNICAAQSIFPKTPHIVFIVADDLGWNDVSFHGSKQIPTPNVDALARDGIILSQYYVQPICSPSRGSLMTGKYPIRIGFQHNLILNSAPWGLPLREKILPQYLKALQYSTHAIGKWHLGFFKKEYLPLERGFDSFFGYYNGLEDYYTHVSNSKGIEGLDLHDNERNVWQYNGTYGPDLFATKARKVILEHDPQKPLFLYFSQQSPHTGNSMNPLQAPEKYVKPMVGIDDEKRKIFAGMVSSMEHSVGEIFEALEISGMLDNTIFIFTTDNGGATQGRTDSKRGSNWPLKGSKGSLWEGGVRGVSFLWSQRLRHRSRVYNELMHISDWLPTILSGVGGSEALNMLPKDIDGVDHWPSLVHGFPSPRKELLLNIDDIEKVEGIRMGRYKLVKGSSSNGIHDKWYDEEGRNFSIIYSLKTPDQRRLYRKNYLKFLRCSKAVRILQHKYGREPRLTVSCVSSECKENLEIRCRVPPPVHNCDAQKEYCLYDIVKDPCEFYSIADELPNVVEYMIRKIERYRAVSIPPKNQPDDPAANPKLHGNVWIPWK